MNGSLNLSGYQITEQLYTGTRTLVYRGIRNSDQQPVVIKVLRNEYPNFAELLQFCHQYTIAKNLNFPSIIQPLTLEKYRNSYALIMEDFGGVSLSDYLKIVTDESQSKKSLPLAEFLQLAIQLTDILHYLYQNRVIHKDIKPANILINPDTKQVKLIDFSISSLLARETQEIQNPNVLEGTLAYLSPEQTGRMNRGIDYRSDFYSLGITFYEWLTGELPFVSADAMELVHFHLAKPPISIHQINSEIPLVLSELVSKLMAKNAEERYQTALGIKHDLEICLEQLQTTGKIESFEIAKRDISDRFIIPEKLYGRENEVNQLLAAFERVSTGSAEMMLVAGFSGIGKTAVVNEVHKPIVRQRGYFIKGKYDQFQRNIPFSAFVQAFRDLMGQLLSESDEQLQTWKNQILAAVGENGQVLIDVIPELENIIGKQLPATELSGSAAQNRFNLLFPKFVQVFTSIEHPLVMFFDDLQWADSASLKLLQLLMQDTGYLLVLGAYRDHEVSPVHPFILTVDEMVKTGATVNTITLPALRESDMNQLVADTLNCELSLAKPLTKLVNQKTQGNPFFATQFLKALQDDKLISFNWEIRHWQCDIAQVKALALTDDVVEFMALQLQKLPTETKDMLKLAACIGAEFDLNTLVIVSEKSAGKTATALWKALQEGLLIPTTRIYKFFTQSDSEEVLPASANPIYRFLHDRVQQAAYLLIPEEQKQLTHLAIGQLLLQNTDKAQQNERIFEIVNQLNYGISLLSSLAQREQYAQLNLRAGRKAKESTAYSAAQHYLAQGIQLLRASGWDVNPDLMQSLYEEAAEVALLNCDFEQMESLIQVVLQQTTTLLGQVKVYEVKLQAYQVQNQQLQAITIGREILQKLGVNFPESVTSLEIQQYVENTLASLPSCAIEELVNFPVMQEVNALAALRIMTSLVPSVYQAAPHLFPIIACEEVNLSLKYGNSPFSAPGYADFGIIVSTVLNKLEEGYQFGQLALKLMDKFSERSVQSMTQFKVAAFNQSNRESIQQAINLLKESYQVGLETGDSVHSLVSTSFRLMYTYLSGVEGLEKLLEELAIYQAKFAKSQHFLSWVHILRYSIKNLTEFRETPSCLGSDASDEAEYVSRICKKNDELALHLFYLCKLMLSFLFRDVAAAIQDADAGEKYLQAGIGMPSVPVYYYCDSLARLTLYPTVDPSQQVKLLSQVKTNQAKLGIYVSAAPINYQHKYFLVEALRCCILGNRAEAIDLYDRAISGAKENGYIQEEALANELAAKFYLNWGKERIAQEYMIQAYYGYARWGAKAKIADLETRYPQLLAPILQPTRSPLSTNKTLFTLGSTTSNSSATSSMSSISLALDFAAILKAYQTLSGEIELEKLLSKLLQIVIENAGADKCAFIFVESNCLLIQALARLSLSQEQHQTAKVDFYSMLLNPQPVEDSVDVPVGLINTVKRSWQPVAIIDATVHPQLINDPYIQQQQPKSILCSPILHQGKLLGILYLENNLATGVFTSDRVELLNLLCTQAAISLQNAQLYRNSQNYAQQLTQSVAKLQANETRFHNLANNIPGMVYQFRLGADGAISTPYVSSGCLDLYEVEPELVMAGKFSLYALHHPDDHPAVEKAIACSAQNLTPFAQEWRIILPSGTVKWIQSAARPERQEDGAILWDGVVIDISDRKHIAAEQTRLLAILESTSDLIGTADPNGKNLYLNRAWRDLLGLENLAEAKGTEIPKYHPEWATDIIVNQGLPTAIRSGIWVGETAVIDRNEGEIPVSQVILAHKSSDGELEYFSTIVRDISDRKQAELAILQKSQELTRALQALQQAQLQMVQSEKMSALGNLVAGIAHEMNNPLGFIAASLKQAQPIVSDLINHLKLYQDFFPDPSQKILDHAEEIDLDYSLEDLPKMVNSMQIACERLKNISTSLRTFSRADKDYKVSFNIHEGIDSTILILKHRLKANEHRPEIEVVTEYGKLPKIECFPGQLNQVFMNILANAIDALEESNIGRILADINTKANRITITTSVDNFRVKIVIADNGSGMSEEVKEKIFDHLFTTKGVGKGTGLGLAIARQIIVEKHQGSISVNSEIGVGTEFVISLPTQ